MKRRPVVMLADDFLNNLLPTPRSATRLVQLSRYAPGFVISEARPYFEDLGAAHGGKYAESSPARSSSIRWWSKRRNSARSLRTSASSCAAKAWAHKTVTRSSKRMGND
jgi:hypothetical protein